MSRPRTALIVGGSVGGLFAALALSRIGWTVRIVERTAEGLSARGAGIATHPQLLAALTDVGVETGPDFGVPDFGVIVSERRMLHRDGSTAETLVFPQLMTAWDRLHRALMEQFDPNRYHSGAELKALDQNGTRVTACLADGEAIEGDLLVAADGFRSTVRRLVAPAVQPVYAGYVAWRGLFDEASFAPDLQREFFPAFSFAVPPGEQMLGYPVAGPDNDIRPGHRRYNIVWYRQAKNAALDVLLTDAQGRRHDISIPPPLIRRSAVAQLRDAARELLPQPFADIVAKIETPYFQPIYDLESQHLVAGRVALIGDAAFVVRPHVGAGVTKVARDALVLARHLDGAVDIDAGLKRFESERLAEGRLLLAHGRKLGLAIMSPNPDLSAMLADTASLTWLDSD